MEGYNCVVPANVFFMQAHSTKLSCTNHSAKICGINLNFHPLTSPWEGTVSRGDKVPNLFICVSIPRHIGKVTSKMYVRECFVFALGWFLSQDKLRSSVPSQFNGKLTPFIIHSSPWKTLTWLFTSMPLHSNWSSANKICRLSGQCKN